MRQTSFCEILAFMARAHRRMGCAMVLLFCVGCVTDAPPPVERPPVERPPVERPPVTREPPTRRPTTPPPPAPDAAHLAPAKLSVVQLKYTSWPLPDSLTGDKTLQVAVIGNDIWVGGTNGLFRLQDGKFEEVSREAVLAMAVWTESSSRRDLVISHGKTLEVYDRGLVSSSLNGKLGNEPITALYARGTQELWIGTGDALYQLKGDKLRKFDEIKSVLSIQAHAQSTDIVIKEAEGSIKILREEGEGWTLRELSQDGSKRFEQVTPASQGEFWGIEAGMLYLRRLQKEEAAWWPFIVQPDAKIEKPGDVPVIDAAWKVSRLLLDTTKGFTWAITQDQILRLDGNEVLQLAKPKELTQWMIASISEDGSLWFSDGKILIRVGQEQKPPSYQEDIAPFMTKSCTKCHIAGGAAAHFPLATFEQVKAGVDKMIQRIETGSMPPPPQPLLGGDAGLLKRWKAEGFLP